MILKVYYQQLHTVMPQHSKNLAIGLRSAPTDQYFFTHMQNRQELQVRNVHFQSIAYWVKEKVSSNEMYYILTMIHKLLWPSYHHILHILLIVILFSHSLNSPTLSPTLLHLLFLSPFPTLFLVFHCKDLDE